MDLDEISDALAVLDIDENIRTSRLHVEEIDHWSDFAVKMKRYECEVIIIVDDQEWDPHEAISSPRGFRKLIKHASVLFVCDESFRANLLPYKSTEFKIPLLTVEDAEGLLRECFNNLGKRGSFCAWDEELVTIMIRRYGHYPGLLCPAAERLGATSLKGLRGVVKAGKLLGHFRTWIPRHASAPEIEDFLDSLNRRLTPSEQLTLAALALSEIAPHEKVHRLIEVADKDALEKLACDRLLLDKVPAGYRIDSGVVSAWVRRQSDAKRLAKSVGISLGESRFDQFWFLFWWVVGGAFYFVMEFFVLPLTGWKSLFPAIVLPVVPPFFYVIVTFGREAWDKRR